jgi:hypothetical protein
MFDPQNISDLIVRMVSMALRVNKTVKNKTIPLGIAL